MQGGGSDMSLAEALQRYGLTAYGRARLLLCCSSVGLLALAWLLFGAFAALLLCTCVLVGYVATSFLCYQPSAQLWRRALAERIGQTDTPTSDHTHLLRPSKQCHSEAQKLILVLVREHVLEWFQALSCNEEFPEEVQRILEHVAVEINLRLQTLDPILIACKVATAVIPYLEVLNEWGTVDYNGVSVFNVTDERCLRAFESDPTVAHRTLHSTETEHLHYRRLLDALIQCAVPPEYRNCDLARVLVREILLRHLVVPTVSLVTGTDFLYRAIPIVLSKAPDAKVQREMKEIQEENIKLQESVAHGHLIVSMPSPKRRLSSVALASYGVSRVPSLPASSLSLPGTLDHQEAASSLSLPGTLDQEAASSLSLQGTLDHQEAASSLSLQGTLDQEAGYSAGEDDVEIIHLPPIYLTSHIQIEDQQGTPHIAYIFKFPRRMLSRESLQRLAVGQEETHLEALKRYSDFLKLHSQLLRSPVARAAVKGLKLPGKHGLASLVTRLPFTSGSPDLTIILERKQGLQSYLQSLASIDTVLESREFEAFLSSGVKTHREAHWVTPHPKQRKKRKRSALPDKARSRPVESLLARYLRTALPPRCQHLQSVHTATCRPGSALGQDAVDTALESVGSRASLGSLSSDHSFEEESFTTGCSQYSSSLHTAQPAAGSARPLLFRMMAFLQKLFSTLLYVVREGLRPVTMETTHRLAVEQAEAFPLTSALLCLATEATAHHNPRLWLNNESTQLALLLAAPATEKFLSTQLTQIVYCEENWVRVLFHLRHTLWPGGEGGGEGNSAKQTTAELKEKAVAAVKKFLPDAFPLLVGAGGYDRSIRHCLECLLNPQLNRHFLLRIVDVFLPHVLPELEDSSFRRELARLRTVGLAQAQKK